MALLTVVRTILFKKYVQFHGRAPRHEFWWWTLALIIANFIAVFIDMSLLNSNVQIVAEPGRVEMSDEGPLATILSLATLLPTISVAVRRLHDVGKSGWWLLVMFVPLLGALYLIFLYVQRGTEGRNIYGPDPLESAAQSGHSNLRPSRTVRAKARKPPSRRCGTRRPLRTERIAILRVTGQAFGLRKPRRVSRPRRNASARNRPTSPDGSSRMVI